AGHRTYNPKQRYFVSEDPSGGGYGFGNNNPIMNSDPTGNMPKWLGTAFKWLGYASSFGLNALHAKWAHIAGAVITTGLTIATLGAAAYTYGGTLIASAVTAGATIAGSVPVAAAAIPTNKGLNIAASVIGGIEMSVMATTAAVDMGLYFMSDPLMSVVKSMINNSGIELDDFYLNCVEPLPEEYKPYIPNLGSVLRNNLPETIHQRSIFFRIRDDEMLKNVWAAFKSLNNHLLSCDVGCILAVAAVTGNPVNLLDIDLLLEPKMNFYLAMSQQIEIPTQTELMLVYIYQLFKTLGSVGDSDIFFEYPIPLRSLEELMLSPGERHATLIPGHIQLIQRERGTVWSTYEFKGNEVTKITGQINEIEDIFYAHARGDQGKKIIFSMRI
ncbi:MAG: hypothetical protein OXC48_12005, partial [Endozoicomonadaceae bacterium]|nr:hypothetical protein [Endozoicomonadaceae bacterium]